MYLDEILFASADNNGGKKWDFASLSILFIFISTILQSIFGFARNATPFFKLLIALFCWLSIFFAYRSSKNIKTMPLTYRWPFIILTIDVIIAFFHSVFWGQVYAGEKYVVLFTNMYALLNMVPFLYACAFPDFKHIRLLLKLTLLSIPINLVILLLFPNTTIHSYFLSYFLIYIPFLLHYVNKKQFLSLIFGAALSLAAFFGGGRQILITMVFAALAYTTPKFVNKKIAFIGALALIVLPIFYIWFFGSNYGYIFNYLDTNVSDNEDLSGNTRTFLYVECMSDYFGRNRFTQIFGQGPLAYYESDFFAVYNRLGIEVPILEWLMQGGIIYYLCFIAICTVSTFHLYRYGNNKLCQSMMIMIPAYFLMSHVSNFVGCSILQLGFWGMIGLSCNEQILTADDDELVESLR